MSARRFPAIDDLIAETAALCLRFAEVTDGVLDGKWGEVCFNEAENRLHAQKGVMAAIIP